MSIWLVLGGVAILLLVVVVIGTKRPRRAEEELAQPTKKPARIDTPGSIHPGGIKALLRSLQTARETGMLELTVGDRSASLYFLFGRLFHVTTGALTGERALQECLTWQGFRYTFDNTAQLPAVQTIERSMDELVA